MKSGFFTSEFIVTAAGIAASILTVIGGQVPSGSAAGVIIGALAAAAAYVAGRTVVKAATVKADGLRADGLRAAAEAAKRG